MAARSSNLQVAPTPRTAAARLRALRRMKAPQQLAALRRGNYNYAEWAQAWPVSSGAPERLELLALLDEDEQYDALRDELFSLSEWCTFACRHPYRCARLGNEFAFIAITTPEWCER